jgi:hypothetical protein
VAATLRFAPSRRNVGDVTLRTGQALLAAGYDDWYTLRNGTGARRHDDATCHVLGTSFSAQRKPMARKTINRKELRDDEAPEGNGETETEAGGDDAKPAPVAKPKRKSRAKVEKPKRLKAFWGIFNQSLKRVAQFDYHQRDQAQKKADEMSTSQKTPHFVRLIKEEISD